jgi:hypothetical protein
MNETKPEVVQSLLLLVDIDIPLETIETWNTEQLVEATVYVSSVHLAASDNPIKPRPMPAFLQALTHPTPAREEA